MERKDHRHIVGVAAAAVTLALSFSVPTGAQTGSVLSEGSWWAVTVRGEGVYRLTTSEVPGLSGADVTRIGMYGGSGEQLSTSNQETPCDGLRPIAIDVRDINGNGRFDGDDEVLFWGEGTDVWRWDDGDQRWEMRRHAYATSNKYYLTREAREPVRVSVAARPTADTALTSYTAVTAVNNDLANIYQSGQLWMGEKFTQTVTERTVTLTLPAQARDIRLRYALASKGSAAGRFTLTTTGLTREHTITPLQVYGSWLEATTAQAQSLAFTLRYTPGESTAEGYLDYIEMNGKVPLAYGSGQLTVRNDQHLGAGRTAEYRLTGGTGTRVWEVRRNGTVREMVVSGGSWADSTTEARTYVVFANGQSPAGVSSVGCQNLTSCGAADYVVVTQKSYKAQAQRIAALHAVMDGWETLVVTDEEVYNEFSSGKPDPMAIRCFLRNLRQRYPERPPQWMLLMGKASYDPRDLLGNGTATLVTFESLNSFDDDGLSYASDDMMGYLDDDEGGNGAGTLDVGIGRLPAKSLAEAQHMVDKVEGYMMRRDLIDGSGSGDWRNYVALLSDDADPSKPGDTSFVHDSEATAREIGSRYPGINIDRLYADAYHQQSDAIGSFYPELKAALTRRMNYGCLLINYIGHGSTRYIGTERYIEPEDIGSYTNEGRLPLFVTSTCSYGYHDLPGEECGAEAHLLATGGAVAIISASRPISHIPQFNTDVILYALDTANTVGDALRLAKNRTSVSPCIGLMGDPGMRLSVPENQVVVTHIDGREVQANENDTATVLSEVTVSCEVRDGHGTLLTDFDGTAWPIVFDRATESHTLANDNPGTEVRFMQQKSILYKGAATVSGGQFSYTFRVPKDVQYQYAAGKLSHYAVSGTDHAAGSHGRLFFGGLNEEAEIAETRPDIRLYLGDTNFRDGGVTDGNPMLIAYLSDSVGINAFGSGLGHDITVTLDGQAGSLIVLNDFYEADLADSRRGVVRYPLSGIDPGCHALTLKAWNIWGYSNTAVLRFTVHGADTAYFASLTVAPNPAHGQATFRYETNNPSAVTSALLQIYSPQGALLATLTPPVHAESYMVGPVRWDLSQTPPGIYLARMVVTTEDGETHQSTQKVIVR